MTKKRFRVQEHCLRSSYGIEAENWLVTNDNHSVVLNNKAEAHMVANMFNDVIGGLNELSDENKRLKKQRDCVYGDLTRLKKDYLELTDENKNLKAQNELIKMEIEEMRKLWGSK